MCGHPRRPDLSPNLHDSRALLCCGWNGNADGNLSFSSSQAALSGYMDLWLFVASQKVVQGDTGWGSPTPRLSLYPKKRMTVSLECFRTMDCFKSPCIHFPWMWFFFSPLCKLCWHFLFIVRLYVVVSLNSLIYVRWENKTLFGVISE